jgi:hypothetical protein
MGSKIELVWKEDDRTIGIMEDNDEIVRYKPLIMLNFELLGYISGENHPYRGYQMMIKTHGGNDFIITITEREIQRYVYHQLMIFLYLFAFSFPLFVTAVKQKTHGVIIQHASFDGSLWTEMVPKVMLDYPNLPRKRPATNWGIQYRTLVLEAPGDKSKLLRCDLEIVYPGAGAIYDGFIHPKVVEGREILVHMKKNLRDASAGMSHSERYDARQVHLRALAQMKLPRDYMAEFTGKHFTYNSVGDREVSFILAHKTASDLLSEVYPGYSDRRLGSQVFIQVVLRCNSKTRLIAMMQQH